MLHPNFVLVGTFLSLIGGWSYFKDTISGKVKPNKVTWFLWAIIPLIAFFAEIQQGVGIQSLVTFMAGFNPLLIFFASFINKKAYWKISYLDIICGVFSIFGIVLWYITHVGNIAILFSIFADALAGVPTIIKSYHEPETENYHVFLFAAIASVIGLLTISVWDFAHYAFPLYLLLLAIILIALIKFKLGKKFA